jgi:serine/threonine protein kinase
VAADVTGNLPTGTVLKRQYRILRKVAQGGMGAVYESTELQGPTGNRRAIKEISPAALPPGERTQAVADFRREAQMLARLQHSNLVKVVETFEELGKHFLVMEFVPGRTLLNVLDLAGGPLAEERVMVWARQMIDVIQYLHSQDPPIIYRDLKPANIMLVEGTELIKLIDFGIARLHKAGKTSDTEAFGTAGYAPPEQYGKGQTDQRSDIYAFAATLHHLLTNRDPSLNPFNWLSIRRYNPGVSVRVDTALMQALNLDPQKRFQSVEAFAQALGLEGAFAPRSRPLQEPTAPAPASPVPTRSKANGQTKKKAQSTAVADALPVGALPQSMLPPRAEPAVAAMPVAASIAAAIPFAPAPAAPATAATPTNNAGAFGKLAQADATTATALPPAPDIVTPTTTTATTGWEPAARIEVEDATTPVPTPAPPKPQPSEVRVPGSNGSTGASGLVISDRLIDLGETRWNRGPVKRIQLSSVGGQRLEGTVIASQPWIAYSPDHFKGNAATIEVKVKRGQLRFGRVQLQVPNLFAMIWTRTRRWLPFFGFWFWLLLLVASSLGRTLLWAMAGAVTLLVVAEALLLLWSWHVKMLVPAERLHTGRLLVKSAGDQQQIEVKVMARPSWLRRALGWTMALVLLTLEIAVIAWIVMTVAGVPFNASIAPF